MAKTYADHMQEISPDELYEGLLSHGFFCEKLPPVFTAEGFFEYCKALPQPFSDMPRMYIAFNSMRNTNVPRQFGLPTPMAYQRLCKCLYDNWTSLQEYFQNTTQNQRYKVSRIHIRKMKDAKVLFRMNYDNWRTDASPEPDILIGKRWLVQADISTCFPSIYSHSIPWALVGKTQAKSERRNGWYNDIDGSVQKTKDGETHGLLIGPHTSNILSEIILCRIDSELVAEGWQYIRNIDDYTCYVETYEKGQQFLVSLNKWLREYDLLLNHKKTEILELPTAAVEQWVRQLNPKNILVSYGKIDYKDIQAYLDSVIEIMQASKGNAAVFNYAIKVIKNQSLTENAKNYYVKTIVHLAVIYPYLIPLLDVNVFSVFNVFPIHIKEYSDIFYRVCLEQQNYEGVYYAIYFALKYGFTLDGFTADKAIETHDCLILLFAYMYFRDRKEQGALRMIKRYAKTIDKSDFDRYWVFLYETLPKSELSGEWKAMKNNGITFLKNVEEESVHE